jgi:peptidoglycan/xylan/chitin deacetylase (PgdA/CDA1 family)
MRSRRSLALTFDDGPDPVWTPLLLDRLSELGARATFFVIASRAAAHPKLTARIADEGHTIGLHCDQHVRHSRRPIDSGRTDTARALAVLASLAPRPTLWRTPWGDLAWWSQQVAAEYGLKLVGWTVDTHDWRGDSAGQMFAATRSELADGAIVLAHDGIGPGARRGHAAQTLRFVTLAVTQANREGLTLESLR